MDFKSDNTAGVATQILKALELCNTGRAAAYGDDEWTKLLEEQMKIVFEHEDLKVFPVITGTAANALALSKITPPYGAVYCHNDAHIHVDECGAPEFYTHGAKLIGLDGMDGKLHVHELEDKLLKSGKGDVHQVQAAAVSISQVTESGTIYSAEEIAALAQVAHRHGCKLHMDGARFANALVAIESSPAEITWKAGVDILSFGATKNGALAAEAVVIFDPTLAEDFQYLRKRAGHLVSKSRFVSAQLLAYLENDLWLHNAKNANVMAKRLYDGLRELPSVSFLFPVEANELFPTLPKEMTEKLREAGFQFYDWPSGGEGCIRLVTSFQTNERDVDRFVSIVKQ